MTVLLLTIISFLAVGEIICRVFTAPGIIASMPLSNPENRYIPGEKIMYHLNQTNCKTNPEINCQGFRDYKEFSKTKKEGVIRLAILGDSFTENPGLNLEEGYVFQLEQLLKKYVKKEVEVYNFGMGGYGTREELTLLKNVVIDYSPDIMVLQYFLNDVVVQERVSNNSRFLVLKDQSYVVVSYNHPPVPLSVPLPIKVNKFLIKKSYLFRFISNSFHNLNKKKEEEVYDVGFENYKASIREILDISKEHNIQLLIMMVPGSLPPKESCDNYRYKETKDLLEGEGVQFIDTCDYTRDYDYKNLKLRDEDKDPHYNKEGNRILAEALFQNLTKIIT